MNKYFVIMKQNDDIVPLKDKGNTAMFSSESDAIDGISEFMGMTQGCNYNIYEWNEKYDFCS